MEPCLSTFIDFPPFFHKWGIRTYIENLQFRWCLPVVKSIEHSSPVVKWETSCLPVRMNTALGLGLDAKHDVIGPYMKAMYVGTSVVLLCYPAAE